MNRTFKTFASASLLMCALDAHAVPISFEFTAAGMGPSYSGPSGSPPLAVPEPFGDFDWALQASMSGTFTLESDTPGQPSYIVINGVPTTTQVGNIYGSPVSQLSLDIEDMHFDFERHLPPGKFSNDESTIFVNNREPPAIDTYNLGVTLGSNIFDDPFSSLRVRFTLSTVAPDPDLITSFDMIENLIYAPNTWDVNFSMLDVATGRGYGLRGRLTSLQQVSVPEPATWSLLAAACALLPLALRKRRVAAVKPR